MERKVTKLEHSHVEVVVTVDEASWKASQDKAFKKLAANVKVDGFRAGKAPAHLIKQRLNPAKVLDEAVNDILPVAYKDVITNEKIQPFTQPKVDVTKISETELELKFVIVTAPVVELGEYKGLEVGKENVEVSEEEVTKAVEASLRENATLSVKEGPAALGDTVVIDFVGTVDGVEFDGGSADNHELELGSGSFIPGFEDQLVGHAAGEDVVVDVTFPENYTAELKGKAAKFACKINEVKEKKLPELNDEFVKELGISGVETVDQFKDYRKNQVQVNKERNARSAYMGKLLEKIASTSTIDIPEEIVEEQAKNLASDAENRMQQSGLTVEQYLQIMGQTQEDFQANMKKQAANNLTNYLIYDKVGEKENIVVSDEEFEAEVAKLGEQYKMTVEQIKSALGERIASFRNDIRMGKIETFLVENNK